jgi:EAL domain-containing protein (putative c-di-GMP-specific phosphodiesterase class I)
MPVTAEGVETAAEARQLQALGCDQAQGSYFGQPIDAAATLALLRSQNPGHSPVARLG